MNTFIITSHLRSSFQGIGAHVRAVPFPAAPPRERFQRTRQAPRPARINVRDDAFELTISADTCAVVRDCRRADRHLVLSLQDPGAAPEHFLCGFDERHWFAAAVSATTVVAAKESLMPSEVRAAVEHAGLRHADRFRRHTTAFIRQGEWFFVRDEQAEADRLRIHRREPLIRPGGGKPHIVDELIRGRGEMVWHHAQLAPGGITDAEYDKQTSWSRKTPGWSRRLLVRQGTILARGAVRHPDHATVWLGTWHRVFINSEVRPPSLGFLD